MSSKAVKRGRQPGVDIDPAAVRAARQAVGLSLAGLAEGIVSRQAMHLIESGKARPSAEVLRHIAIKTGKAVSDFYPTDRRRMSPGHPVRLSSSALELERLIRTRAYREATELGARLVDSASDSEEEPWLRLLLGEALVMNRQPEQAILELRGARARFDEVLDQRSLIDALDWEGMALFLLDDPLCLPVLLDALGRSRGLSPGGELLRVRILTHIATVHVSRHAWRDAIRYYEEASRTSENLRDLAQIARAYDGLSQAYASLGQSARAIAYANKALALYATQSDLAGLSRAENNLGDLLLRLDEVDAAEPHLRRALEGCQSMGLDRRGSGYVLVNLAEVAYRRGDSDEARRLIAQAVDLARELGERVVQANSELLLARISAQTRDPREADRHFNSAIELLQDLEMPDRMREAHLEYGRLLRKRGLIAEAADQFELAAEVQSRGSDVGSLEAWA